MKQEQEIYSVSEAFSTQPLAWFVGKTYHSIHYLKEIRRESIYDSGDPYDFYVGYDTFDEKVFQIRVSAATVQFK